MSFRKTILDAAAISSVSMLRLAAQFFVIPFLARLLSPADYGVVSMAMPLVAFANMLADAGISMSLVRAPAENKNIWSTCFWLSVLLGAGLMLVIEAAAPLAATIMHEPQLRPVVASLALIVFFQALSAVPGAALQKDHKFKLLAGIEIVVMFCSISTAVVMAYNGAGVWSLVGQQLMIYVVRVILLFSFSSFRPKLVYDFHAVTEHLIFGRDIVVINLVIFFTRSIDSLVIGKVLTTSAVGVYSMAYQFAGVPFMLVIGPLQFVLYARLAKFKENTEMLRSVFLLLSRGLAIVIFPVMGMVAVAHQPIFDLLLSEKWAESGRVFSYLAMGFALNAVTALGTTITLVLGRTDLRLRLLAEFGAIWIAALCVCSHLGLEVLAIAFSTAVIVYSPRYLGVVLPLMQCSRLSYWQVVRIPIVLTALCVAVYWQLQQTFVLVPWALILLSMILALLGIACGALIQRRLLKAEVKAFQGL